jgi:hypothetical protein
MLDCFKKGIPIDDYSMVVPWLISESQLVKYIPVAEIDYSVAGWPQLKFTLFGITAVYGFNFVTDPQQRLTEVQYYNERPRSRVFSYRKFDRVLCCCFGMPNTKGTETHRLWDGGSVIIWNHLTSGYRPNVGHVKWHGCHLRYEGKRLSARPD